MKKKRLEKLLALLLAVTMCFSMLPVSAFAEDGADVQPVREEQEEYSPEPEVTPHEHDYVPTVTEPSCEAGGYTTWTCSCGDFYVTDETGALGHTAESVEAVTPTCTEAGHEAGTVCVVCGKILDGCTEIPATGHTPEAVGAMPSTCTEHGHEAGSICTVCGEILTGCGELPLAEHTPENVAEVPAEPDKPGMTAGVKCSVCGAILEGCEEIEALPEDEAADERVRVIFECTPEETQITVYAAVEREDAEENADDEESKWTVALDENGEPVAIQPEEDCSYLLLPGTYLYDALCEDYVPVERAELTVVPLKKGVMQQIVTIALSKDDEGSEIRKESFGRLNAGISSGTVGDLSWYLDNNSNLYIHGYGDLSANDPVYVGSIVTDSGIWESARTLTIYGNVTSIGNDVFSGFSRLESFISSSSSLKSIGNRAFSNCTSLTSVTFSETCVQTIGSSAFYNCKKLSTVTIPHTVTRIGTNAFSGCSSLAKAYFAGTRAQWNTVSVSSGNDYLTSIIKCEIIISFDANGGSNAPESQRATEGNSITLSSTRPTRYYSVAGSYYVTLNPNGGDVSTSTLTAQRRRYYYFRSWNTRADGSGTNYYPGGTYSANTSAILYAQWDSSISTETVTLPTPTRAGYIFRGWASSNTAASGVTGSYRPDSDVTLYAIWEKAYLISYDANGGINAPASQLVPQGETLTLTSAIPLRSSESIVSYTVELNANGGAVSPTSLNAAEAANYIFKSWNTSADGSGTSYEPGVSFTPSADMILYAQWDRSISNEAVTLPTPTREGYIFKGWATSSTAANGVTGSYTPSGNVTLYAIWQIIQYTISYDANGGSGAPANQVKDYGKSLTLSTKKPARNADVIENYTVTLNANGGSVSTSTLSTAKTKSYTFACWNTSSDGSGVNYAPGASYAENADLALYAKWNSSTSTAAVTLPTPTREGYIFKGWATSSSASSGITGSYTPSGNVTLYAIWQIIQYTISYDANGGSGAPASQTKRYGYYLTLSSTKPTRNSICFGNYTVTLDPNDGSGSTRTLLAVRKTDFTFKNWNTKADASGTSYASGQRYTVNSDATLYAQWSIGTSTKEVTLPTPSWEGHIFKGWATSDSASSGVSGSYTPTEDITLYAVWQLGEYTVDYDANDGTGAPDSQVKLYGSDLILNGSVPTRDGFEEHYTVTLDVNGGDSLESTDYCTENTTSYTFREWNTKADGSGVGYAPGAVYSADEAITLYAQWDENTVRGTIDLPTPTRDGYTFIGWAESATASSGVTGSYTPSENVTLYAVWAIGGTWGENLSWVLANGTLTISGVGAMKDLAPAYHVDSEVYTTAWLAHREEIFSVVIEEGVTSIGCEAFRGCSNLTSLVIPEGVTLIDNNAIRSCSALEEVTLPQSLTKIGDYTFTACRALRAITIPANVEAIGGAFSYCESLTDFTIPESVTTIESGTFYKCAQLANITIPESVTTIGSDAFSDCDSLTRVQIPASVEAIGSYAFSDCDSLTRVQIPTSVEKIGSGAFSDCSSLTEISVDAGNSVYCDSNGVLLSKDKTVLYAYPGGKTGSYSIPASVTEIGNLAFMGCSGLTGISIPESVVHIDNDAFECCTGLTSVTLPSGIEELPFAVFHACSKLKSVTIPAGVKSIGQYAFYECSELTDVYFKGDQDQWEAITIDSDNDPLICATVHFPSITASGTWGDLRWSLNSEGLLTISGSGPMKDATRNTSGYPDFTFKSYSGRPWESYLSQIKTVLIKEGVTSIGEGVFYNTKQLTRITIPESVAKIGKYAFYDCSGLKGVTIPAGVTGIGNYLFYGCSSLANVAIPESVTSISMYAFNGCSGLTSVTIPAGVTSIDRWAFSGCSSLTNITIPEGVTSFGEGNFASCSSLTSVTIPGSVKSIGWRTFYCCSSLTSVTIPEGVTEIGREAFYGCSGLTSVTIPESVTSIVEDAFRNCSGLKTAGPIGGGYNYEFGWTKVIPYHAFSGCSNVTSITIPSGMTAIKDYAFSSCSSLTDAYYDGTLAEWDAITIGAGNTPLTGATLHYLAESGSCGAGLRWVLDSTGILTISGEGEMDDYSTSGAPWFSLRSRITALHIDSGVTNVGNNAFYGCSNMSSVTIPESVTQIGDNAFYPCHSLTNVYYGGTKAQWETISVGTGNSALADASLNCAKYSVTFDADNGTENTIAAVSAGSKVEKPADPIREGARFLGWFAADSSTAFSFADTAINGDTVLIAHWELFTCPVRYDANGGTGAPAVQSKSWGQTLTLSSTKPTREGYDFLGWALDPSATEAEYQPGDSYTAEAPLTLYAVWQLRTYTVCYDANGGSGAPSDQAKMHFTAITLSSTVPIREGYDFLGWAASMTAAEANYQPNDTYSNEASVTLYAVWRIKTYTVNYDANGGIGAPASQTKTHFATMTLSSTIPSCTGYTFLGWATHAGASLVEYAPGDSYETEADTTLYAVWERKVYTVRYDANGGSGAPAEQTKPHFMTLTLSSVVPTRDDSDFLGWSTSRKSASAAGDVAQYQPGDSYSAEADVTLYAVWRYKRYTLHFDANGGSNAPADQVKTHYYALTLSSTVPTRTGYNFAGWASSPSATNAQYRAGGSYTVEGNATLYAVWTLKTYTIAYDANGGAGAPAAQTKTHFTSLTLSSTIPTREGYDFLGWALSTDATQAVFQPGDIYSLEGNRTLYAVWQIKTYSVSYNANGGSGAPSAQTKTHFTVLTLSNTIPTREGYDFLGWAASKTAQAAQYQPGASYSTEGNATLYAVWQLKTYTISFDANGGTGAPEPQTKTHFAALTLSDLIPTREGYDFLGWSDSVTASEAQYQPGASYTAESNVKLYAVWHIKSYTVSYDANEGTGAPEPQTKTHFAALTLSDLIPTREGYDFLGWAVNSPNAEAQYQPGSSFALEGNTTLYAVWQLKTYTVSFDANGGEGAPIDQIKTHFAALTLSDLIPSRQYYDFLGWAIRSDANGPDYQPGDSYLTEASVTLFAVWTRTIIAQGESDEGIHWTLYEDGELVIAPTDGSGRIAEAPWLEHKDQIRIVTIKDGVTKIGENAFKDCENLTDVSIPDSVTEIGSGAFAGCTSLTNIVIPEGTVVAEDALSDLPEVPTSFTLDHDYLALKVGETTDENNTLHALGLSDEWLTRVRWTVSADGTIPTAELSDPAITVTDGVVTAQHAGTVYAIAWIAGHNGEPAAMALCRVDVVETVSEPDPETGKTETHFADGQLTGVRLLDPKATVELYKTDYARITVIPELKQNSTTNAASPTILTPENNPTPGVGMAIESARLAEIKPDAKYAKAEDVFLLSVVDDRTLEIIPEKTFITADAATLKTLRGSYKATLYVTVDGTEFEAGVLTLTVKKTLPKLTAKAVKLNSFFADSQTVIFTGGVPEKIEVLDAPLWLNADSEEGTLALGFNHVAPYADGKYSGKVNLNVQPEGWAVKLPVTVAVSAAKTAPKLTLKPVSVSLQPDGRDYAGTAVTVTPALFANAAQWPLQVLSIDGKDPAEVSELSVSVTEYAVKVMAASGAPAGTHKVTLGIDGAKSVVLTVKLLASSAKPTLTAKAVGFIDTGMPQSPITITLTPKNVNPAVVNLGTVKVWRQKGKDPEEDVTACFDIVPDGLTVTLRQGGTLETGYTYTAEIPSNVTEKPTRIKLTVKFTDPSKVKPSVTLKASGSIDVIRPASSVTLTPTVKNLYGWTLSGTDLHILRTYNGTAKKACSESADALFDVTVVDGKYVVTAKPGAVSSLDKFAVKGTVAGMELAKPVAFTVKMGTAKVTQSTKAVTLVKTDKYSTGTVLITPTDATLSAIDWGKSESEFASPLYTLRHLGGGEFAIGFKAGQAPKAGTVKIPVFFTGNMTGKPNATVSVSVKLA